MLNEYESGTCQVCGVEYELERKAPNEPAVIRHYWINNEDWLGISAMKGFANICVGSHEKPAEHENHITLRIMKSLKMVLSTAEQTGITLREQAKAAEALSDLALIGQKKGEPLSSYKYKGEMMLNIGANNVSIEQHQPAARPKAKNPLRPKNPLRKRWDSPYKAYPFGSSMVGCKPVNANGGPWEWSSLNIGNPVEERMIRESLDLGRDVLLEEYE